LALKHPAGILPALGTAKSERIKNVIEAAKINLTKEEWLCCGGHLQVKN
jgi:predicted oxidoreductase